MTRRKSESAQLPRCHCGHTNIEHAPPSCPTTACFVCGCSSFKPRGVEHHNDRLRRLVGEVADRLRAEGLAPADAVWVAEGAADRIRREAEEAKRADRKVSP